jgi:GABA(A) receptor-associated protein
MANNLFNSTLSNSKYVPYSLSKSLEERKEESQRMISKYFDRIPIIVEKSNTRNNTLPDIDKHKYLVPKDLTIGQFQHVIRKRIKLDSTTALFIFVNKNIIPPSTSFVSSIHDEYKSEDGFLYINYATENTFGDSIYF